MKNFPLPSTKKEFTRKWDDFQAWLKGRGSAIMVPTNSYEIARFLTDSGIGIVYVNGSERITSWINGADTAWLAYKHNREWRAVEKVNRGKKTLQDYRAIVARDGNTCVYCGVALAADVATIEHIVPVSAGGPNHLSNKTLACRECNAEAGHMSVREKIELAIRKRNPDKLTINELAAR